MKHRVGAEETFENLSLNSTGNQTQDQRQLLRNLKAKITVARENKEGLRAMVGLVLSPKIQV